MVTLSRIAGKEEEEEKQLLQWWREHCESTLKEKTK
jgi:hypothetical protein